MIPPFVSTPNSVFISTYSINKSTGTDSQSNAYTWVKPPGTGMIFIGALAPGGDGYSVPAGTNAGGGGGSTGNMVNTLVPANLLPDALKIQGPTAANNSLRILDPTSGFSVLTLNAGNDSSGATGGSQPAAATIVIAGNTFSLQGAAGKDGGAAGIAGTNATVSIAPVNGTGGAGGGGTNATGTSAASGGAVLVPDTVSAEPYPYPNLTSAAAGVNGANGYVFLSPLAIATPGAGGGGGLTRGGDGGNGGLGQGGGGGGGNTTGQGPSRGGKGGPGLVIIYSW